jgi:hypothetical protein
MELIGHLLQSPAWTQINAVGRREVAVSAAYQVSTDETWEDCLDLMSRLHVLLWHAFLVMKMSLS